jgi:hypothetical protein
VLAAAHGGDPGLGPDRFGCISRQWEALELALTCTLDPLKLNKEAPTVGVVLTL